MRIFCMSDIHGCLAEFEEALSLVIEHLEEPGTMLCLIGDYIHGIVQWKTICAYGKITG